MRKILYTIFLIFAYFNAWCYYPIVKNYTKEQYKGTGKNWDIVQNSSGIIWIANDKGILDFDSNIWGLTMANNRTSIRSLYYMEESDRLYFGAISEFGYIDYSNTSGPQYVSLLSELGKDINDIWGIHHINNKFYLRENNKVFIYSQNEATQEIDFKNKITVSEVIDDNLYLFVKNIGVVKIIDPSSNSSYTHYLPGTEKLKDIDVCAILKGEGDELIFVSTNNGIYKYKNNTLSKDKSKTWDRVKNTIIYCATANDSYIALGTVNDGVFIYNKIDKSILHLNTRSGLQNNTVLSLYFDLDENLWLGLDKGLDMIKLNNPEYRLFSSDNLIGAGYCSELFNGKLYLGTNQGLYYAQNTDSAKKLEDTNFTQSSHIKGQMWHLLNYDKHLFCCADQGLGIIDINGGYNFIPLNGVWRLISLKDWPEYLLGCSYDKLFLLKKARGRWNFHKWVSGFEESSKVFEEDAIDGSIWFSHWIKGLYRLKINYEQGTVEKCEYFSKANNFPQDWSNVPITWDEGIIFETVEGFYSFDRTTSKVEPIEELNKLFLSKPEATSVYKCKDGALFFSSSKHQVYYSNGIMDSLSLYSLANRRIVGFEDIHEFDDGTLILNTEDGYSVINTESLKHPKDSSDYHLFIKDISVLKEQRDSIIYTSYNHKLENRIVLSHRENSLRIRVALPYYEGNNGDIFSYRLESYDDNWSIFQSTQTKEYIKVKPGNYKFQVRAISPYSKNTLLSQIEITIKKPWYTTSFFILIYIILGILLIYICVQKYKHSIEKKALQDQKEREAKHKEEMMARDLKQKANELASTTMDIVRKNEILQQIDTGLQKAVDSIVEDRNKSLKIISKIRSDIKENINHDNTWNQFEQNFDLVYTDFLKKLERQHPDISTSDKKLCAYLKMGLSSKEIAPLLNITVRSVEMNRYRLRKKFLLPRESNLNDYLSKF